jgi:hypothetical protein
MAVALAKLLPPGRLRLFAECVTMVRHLG